MRVHILLVKDLDQRVEVSKAMTEMEMEERPDLWAEAIEVAREETREAAERDPYRLLAVRFGVVVVDVSGDDVERAFARAER